MVKSGTTGVDGGGLRGRFSFLIKRACFAAAAVLLSLLLIELVSAAALLIAFRKDPGARFLLSHFPAQFRLNKQASAKFVFMNTQIEARHLGDIMDTFNFDPVMGFRDEQFMARYGPPHPDLQICTIGGSTTAYSMWPVFLPGAAEGEGVRERVSVLNAGVPGYMSNMQRVYLAEWVLGNAGRRCDIVLSMDGVNDVHFRIAGMFHAVNNGVRWNPRYHAYQQKLEMDVRRVQTVRGAAAQLISAAAASDMNRWYVVAKVMPYTSRLAAVAALRAERKKRDESAPLFAKNFAFNKKGELILPPPAEDKIISAWRDSELDLAGTCRMRGIPFVSYLQPVFLQKYYPAAGKKNPAAANFANAVQIYIGHQLSSGFLVDVQPIYSKSELMFADLQRKYPENFGSLIYLFKDSTNPKLYIDPVHYSRAGNEKIAAAVIRDLVARKLLHKKGG